MSVKSVRRRSSQGPKKVLGSPHRNSPVKRRRSGGLAGPSASSASEFQGPSATNIKVSVRVRPPNSRELHQDEDSSFRSIIEVVDDKLLIFDPKADSDNFYFHGKVQRRRDLNKRPQKDHKFTFDRVFSPEEDNATVFQNTTLELVDALFAGYNSSVFVYGATGAGKTFTMLGKEGNPGITFRTAEAIYERIQSSADELSCEVSISYLEIYNENVVDLINPNTQALNIREDGQNGVNIPGLTKYKPKTPQELLKLLQHGNSNRSQHPTDANSESSRSHAIFQVFLTQKDRSSGLTADVKVAKLSMIDLAGSERGTVTSSRGAARKKEGANINKSLLALGNCINALAEGSKYIPFRNSKLTRILKDSLGGNCRTVMISNVSPSSKTYEDTYNTLKYAERAKKIKVKLKKNVMSVDFHIAQYAKIVENLKQEISELKDKLRLTESRSEDDVMDYGQAREVASLKGEMDALKKENQSLKKKLEHPESSTMDLTNGVAFQGVKMLFKKRLELESQIKLYHVRMSHCQIIIERTNTISKLFHISEVSNANKNCLKTLKSLESMIDNLTLEKKNVDKEYLEAKNKFDIETSSMKLKQEYTSQLETLENQLNSQHLYKFSQLIASERRKDNYLIGLFLPNLITSNLKLNSLDGSYNGNILKIIDYFCGKKVSWDEDLIESSNSDSNDQLMGHLYAENVSIGDSMKKASQEETHELSMETSGTENEVSPNLSGTLVEEEKQQPAPMEKEKHSKVITPTSIFELSMEEEEEEAKDLSKDVSSSQAPAMTLDAHSPALELPTSPSDDPPCSSVFVDLNSTQTLSRPEIESSSKSKPLEMDLNATHTIDQPSERNTPLSVDLNSTHTVMIPSPCLDSNLKENNRNIPNGMHKSSLKVMNSDESSKSIRRETFSLIKPTVAVHPISQSFKTEKISPRVILTKNAHGKSVSRTPPALGAAEPRRKLAASKSTSRLLTSTDVRFGSSNGSTFRRLQSVSSSSAPSYMASTAASSNRLNKHKENVKPSSSSVQPAKSMEPPKLSLMRHLKRTLPKKS